LRAAFWRVGHAAEGSASPLLGLLAVPDLTHQLSVPAVALCALCGEAFSLP
jgi:hypothetical protein